MGEQIVDRSLQGKVALVAGATRGAGRAIAVELCRAGAFVYATGRSSRLTGPSDMDRPETIEETGELMQRDRGRGQRPARRSLGRGCGGGPRGPHRGGARSVGHPRQ